jgi:CBS domain-containing protein
MTSNPACCTPNDTLEHAARAMLDHDCGALPVCESRNPGKVLGMVTDRDLAVRGLARGKGSQASVADCMTSDVHSCRPDSPAEEIEETMARHQVRRVPIIDADGRLVGIISQADLALHAGDDVTEEDVAHVIEAVSQPTRITPAQGD